MRSASISVAKLANCWRMTGSWANRHPLRWVVLDQMPLNANGKIDRQRLPEPPSGAGAPEQDADAEWTPVEELVTGIWSEVLKLTTVGRDENFFELGGHSLLATQVITRIRNALQNELPLRALFINPTVAGLAEVIDTELCLADLATVNLAVTVPCRETLAVADSPPTSKVV